MKVLVLQMTRFHGSLIFHENANEEDKETINVLSFHNAWQQHQKSCIRQYSQLSLNEHLYKTDTSLRRTPCGGHGRFSVI